MPETKQKLYRLPKEGIIAGVASGFAKYFNMDATLMRLIFLAALLITSGAAVIVYIVLAIVMPTPDQASEAKLNVGQKVESLAEEVKDSGRARNLGNYIGIGLIVFGAWLLLGQIFPNIFRFQWNLLWPGLIVIFGLLIILRSKKS